MSISYVRNFQRRKATGASHSEKWGKQSLRGVCQYIASLEGCEKAREAAGISRGNRQHLGHCSQVIGIFARHRDLTSYNIRLRSQRFFFECEHNCFDEFQPNSSRLVEKIAISEIYESSFVSNFERKHGIPLCATWHIRLSINKEQLIFSVRRQLLL